MGRKLFVFVVAVGMAVMTAACGSPPQAAVDAAKVSLDQAATAGAGEYAPAALQTAQDAQAALDAELKVQDGKWFKSYAKAAELAAAAKSAGDAAVTAATEGKAKAQAEATTALEGAKALLAETQALLEKAPKGKGTAADLEAMKTDLATAATAITEGEAELGGERFMAAKAKAEAATATTTTVKTAIETAMAAKGQKR